MLPRNMSSRSVITHTRRPGLPVQMELLQPPVHPSRFASLIRHGAASRYSAPYASASVRKSVVGRWPAAIRSASAGALSPRHVPETGGRAVKYLAWRWRRPGQRSSFCRARGGLGLVVVVMGVVGEHEHRWWVAWPRYGGSILR